MSTSTNETRGVAGGGRIDMCAVDRLLALYWGKEVTLELSQLGHIVPKERMFSATLHEASCARVGVGGDDGTYRLRLVFGKFGGFGIEMTDAACGAHLVDGGLCLSFAAGDAVLRLTPEDEAPRQSESSA